MLDEVLHVIRSPGISDYYTQPTLGVEDNSLHFLDSDSVMNEGRWTKQLTIGPIFGVFKALEFWKNGPFFFLFN